MNLRLLNGSLALMGLLLLAACNRPEASRVQGGGPGGDTGNRPPIVRMHEGSRPYHHTPQQVPGETPALDTASQAGQFGRR
jgi:hypothetical protein